MEIYNLGNRVVNNYLISFDGGYILTDTGYSGGYGRFLREIRRHGIDPGDYSRSWGAILKTGAATLYPSHGGPFRKPDLGRFMPHLEKIRLRPLKKQKAEKD